MAAPETYSGSAERGHLRLRGLLLYRLLAGGASLGAWLRTQIR